MSVTVIPFDERYLDETLALLTKWSPDHPELGERSLYDWQQCQRYIALANDRVVGHIAQVPHTFRHGDGRPPVQLGWAITLVLDMSDDNVRKAAGRMLLSACETADGLKYAGVGMVKRVMPTYLRRGHQVVFDSCSMFARFLNPEKALRYFGKSSSLAPIVRAAEILWQPDTEVRNGRLESISSFDPQWDTIWDDIQRQQYDLYGVRDAAYLNYKLTQPNREYRAFVHRDVSDQIDGYVIFRRAHHRVKDMDLVKVCDLVGARPAQSDMLALVMAFALEAKPVPYGVVGISSRCDDTVYRSAGLFISKPYPVALAAGVDPRIHISFFDSDLDNLW